MPFGPCLIDKPRLTGQPGGTRRPDVLLSAGRAEHPGCNIRQRRNTLDSVSIAVETTDRPVSGQRIITELMIAPPNITRMAKEPTDRVQLKTYRNSCG